MNWRQLLGRTDVLILDTETTGFDSQAEVIDIAMIDTTGAVRMNTLSLPEDDIPQAASEIHGLTYEKLRKARASTWPSVHRKMSTVMARASLVLAWNAPFDRRMLEQMAGRHGLPMPKASWHDLLADYRALRPSGSHKLRDAVRREGIAIEGPEHLALPDCQTVLAVMRAVART